MARLIPSDEACVTDAVVIGAGPNGLTAANLLADAGWSVVVLESQAVPGGAVRSGELTQPGAVHDLFSAFYPLTAVSPHLQSLDLHEHGLRMRHSPRVLAHPLPDGQCAVLDRDLDTTAASLDAFASGDGDGWRGLVALWDRLESHLLGALFAPFPPTIPGLRMASELGSDLLRTARQLLLPVARMGQEHFRGEGGRLLLTGNAMHADIPPRAMGSGMFGWLLTSLGQRHGYPVPEGGAQSLTDALVARLRSRGGQLVCNAHVDRVVVRDGRAVGVLTTDGERVAARRAVLADTTAPALYLDLVGAEHLPAALVRDLQRFQYDHPTVKVDWLLRGPIPWTATDAGDAGTVHLGGSTDEFEATYSQLARDLLPAHPTLVMGQMNVADPSRSPAPTQTVWAYTKVPRRIRGDAGGQIEAGPWTDAGVRQFVERVEAEVERHAPGFRDQIEQRHVMIPSDLEARNENLVDGAVNGGTAQLYQQLVFRPTPGMGRPETPVRGLYLASAAAHPGGGVHGGPGANAAHAALLGPTRRTLLSALNRRLRR